jgi:hypothetical protein
MAVGFTGRVRQWREDKPDGLAVVDVSAGLGRRTRRSRQMRVTGALGGTPFTGSTTLVAGGGLCVGVSCAALRSAGVAAGDEVELSIAPETRR